MDHPARISWKSKKEKKITNYFSDPRLDRDLPNDERSRVTARFGRLAQAPLHPLTGLSSGRQRSMTEYLV